MPADVVGRVPADTKGFHIKKEFSTRCCCDVHEKLLLRTWKSARDVCEITHLGLSLRDAKEGRIKAFHIVLEEGSTTSMDLKQHELCTRSTLKSV